MDQKDSDIPIWRLTSAHSEVHPSVSDVDQWNSDGTKRELVDEGWGTSSQTVSVGDWLSCQPVTSSDLDATMDDDAMAGDEDAERINEETSKCYAVQMSPEQFQKQSSEYTKAAVRELLKSPDYIRKDTTCRMCWSIWSEGMFTDTCQECGGFAMKRPCPICLGKCGSTWTREVEMSHEHSAAHWDGECSLPPEEREAYMRQTLSEDATEDSVLAAMEGLTT